MVENKVNWIIYFVIIAAILAIMDGLNFYWPHNKGFYSLTYGESKVEIIGVSADAWHCLKILLLSYIAYDKVGFNFKLITAAIIFVLTQLLLYNYLIKLL